MEELAPGKIVFFFSRNQDSPNIFHGGSEFINALSLIYLLDIKPENIQVVFLESMEIRNDPLHELYKNIISRGGTPIHIRTLKKNIEYHQQYTSRLIGIHLALYVLVFLIVNILLLHINILMHVKFINGY